MYVMFQLQTLQHARFADLKVWMSAAIMDFQHDLWTFSSKTYSDPGGPAIQDVDEEEAS